MTEPRIAELVDRAFDYRGYVTLRRRDGSSVVGFVYHRGPSHVELFDQTATQRLRIPLDEIADLAFSGEDAALKAQAVWERRQGRLEARETPAWGEWDDARPVLFIVALESELRTVARAVGASHRGGRVHARVGACEMVARAVGMGGGSQSVVAEERPRMVVSCGFSGALDAALAPGDVVLATAVRDENGDVLAAPSAPRTAAASALRGLRCFEGELACATSVAATADEKRALARPGLLAVDLESYPAARAAAEAGIPWLGLRVVVDPLDEALPPFTRVPRQSYLLPAVKYAMGGPRAVADLVRLGSRARRAAQALELAVRSVAPGLADGEARA